MEHSQGRAGGWEYDERGQMLMILGVGALEAFQKAL
jgi:hypothetical protein